MSEQSLRRRLPAGVVDSGLASLATFAIGIVAVNIFDAVDRGVYAVFFTAFVAGALLASELIFTPAEVEAVEHPVDARVSLVPRNLLLGSAPCLLASLAASLVATAVTASYGSTDVIVGLAVTSAVAAFLSPMQDHLRRMLHIGSRSWIAASMSLVQVIVAVGAMTVGVLVDVPDAWLPFGALATANAVSLATGWILAARRPGSPSPTRIRFRDLTRRGVWFALSAGAPALSGFATAAIIAWLAGPEDLGYAESARVVAQPIFVIAIGLKAVLHPRSVRAAMDGDRDDARHTNRLYLGLMGLVTVGYVAVTGWDWVLNPMALLVPSAYVLTGLVALTVVANSFNSMWLLQTSELAGARRERSLAGISWMASAASVTISFTAHVIGAYARPLGSMASAGVRYDLQRRSLGRHYTAADAGD